MKKRKRSERKSMKAKVYIDGKLMFTADCREHAKDDFNQYFALKSFCAVANKTPLSPYDALRKLENKMCHVETDEFMIAGTPLNVKFVSEWRLDGEHAVIINGHKLDGIERAQLRLK